MMKEELGMSFFYPSMKYKKLSHQVGVLNSLMMFPCNENKSIFSNSHHSTANEIGLKFLIL